MRLLNIGYGNLLASSRILAIISPDSAPVKRLIQEKRDEGKLIDATAGRKTRSVICSDNGFIILSAIQADTLNNRMTEEGDMFRHED